MIELNNLTEEEQELADLIWQCRNREEFAELMDSLDPEQFNMAAGLAQLMQWGGDQVKDTAQARDIITRIRSL